jgi:protein-disulfide isomerase
VHRLLDERNSAAVKADATAVDAVARGNGITSTPTIVVGKTGTAGRVVSLTGPTDEQGLAVAIDAALR